MARIYAVLILFMVFLSCTPYSTETPRYELGIPRAKPTIYIKVDKAFSQRQKELIDKAFRDWEKASNYKISFQVTWDQPKPGPYWQYKKPDQDSGLFFWYLPKNNTYIPEDLLDLWTGYVGIMVYGQGEYSGNVIIFDTVREEHFYSVALHEIGHLLGLQHISQYSVMHPNAIGHCLNLKDIQQLCKLYDCVPVSQCETPDLTAEISSPLSLSEVFPPELLPASPQNLSPVFPP